MSSRRRAELKRWVCAWGHAYPEHVESVLREIGLPSIKAAREEGIVHRLCVPIPPPVSARPDPVRPWARAIFEKEARTAATARWPALKQEIVAGALKPSRVSFLIDTYGFCALEQFE